MTNEDCAWAAGFFDGEGCSFFENRKGGMVNGISMQVSQSGNLEPLLRFVSIMGGGRIRALSPGGKRQKPAYRWQVCGLANMQHCLNLLWPYLGAEKKTQAMRAIEAWITQPRKRFFVSKLTLDLTREYLDA